MTANDHRPTAWVLVIGGADGQWADWLAGGHLTPDIAAHVFDRAGLAREA
ncbi:hypothetical protein [Actinoplanes subtropicus]|nr:hypothetical protein [Actinoplanes subtropicus]